MYKLPECGHYKFGLIYFYFFIHVFAPQRLESGHYHHTVGYIIKHSESMLKQLFHPYQLCMDAKSDIARKIRTAKSTALQKLNSADGKVAAVESDRAKFIADLTREYHEVVAIAAVRSGILPFEYQCPFIEMPESPPDHISTSAKDVASNNKHQIGHEVPFVAVTVAVKKVLADFNFFVKIILKLINSAHEISFLTAAEVQAERTSIESLEQAIDVESKRALQMAGNGDAELQKLRESTHISVAQIKSKVDALNWSALVDILKKLISVNILYIGTLQDQSGTV